MGAGIFSNYAQKLLEGFQQQAMELDFTLRGSLWMVSRWESPSRTSRELWGCPEQAEAWHVILFWAELESCSWACCLICTG